MSTQSISTSVFQQVYEKADVDRNGVLSTQELEAFEKKQKGDIIKSSGGGLFGLAGLFGGNKKIKTGVQLLEAATLLKKEFEVFKRNNPSTLSGQDGITLDAIKTVAARDGDSSSLHGNDIREDNLKQVNTEATTPANTDTTGGNGTRRRFNRLNNNTLGMANGGNGMGSIYIPPMMDTVLRNTNSLVQANAQFLRDYTQPKR